METICVLPTCKTTSGLTIGDSSFHIFNLNDLELITEKIFTLLPLEANVIPHPTDFNMIRPEVEYYGYSRWLNFAKKCELRTFELKENQVEVTLNEWDGTGYDGVHPPLNFLYKTNLIVF